MKALENMRLLALLVLVLAVSPAAAASVPVASAAASETKLEVNENCVELAWPCWAIQGSSQPAATISIPSGGAVMFVDEKTAANIAWTADPGALPSCEAAVPVAPTPAKTNWHGKCAFSQAGIYKFESATMFHDAVNDYRHYEIVVEGTPTDATSAASGATQTEATLNGSIAPEGNPGVEYHFEYEGPGVTGKPSTPVATLSSADFAAHAVSAKATGLQAGALYTFRLVATYGVAKTPVLGAAQETFKTQAITPPAATTTAAEGIEEAAATLSGTVDPGGEETDYFFEYDTTAYVEGEAAHGQISPRTALSASGGDSQRAAFTLKGLTPNTTYHFRLIAENKHGSRVGLDQSFTTISPPTKEPSSQPPAGPGPPSTPTPTPEPTPAADGPESIVGPLVALLVQRSLKLTAHRHASAVRVSLEVASSGVGGHLEVDLIASAASLGGAHRGSPRVAVVGRLVRGSISAGKQSILIVLDARAKNSLRRHHKLRVTVKIILTPTTGPVQVLMKSIVLRA